MLTYLIGVLKQMMSGNIEEKEIKRASLTTVLHFVYMHEWTRVVHIHTKKVLEEKWVVETER